MSSAAPYRQSIEYSTFDTPTLIGRLALREPPFAERDRVFRQLEYLAHYVFDNHLPTGRCKSILIEHEYVDRDHMVDHSTFYASSLFPYANVCKRVHFFSLRRQALRSKLQSLLWQAASAAGNQGLKTAFEADLRAFSKQCYIGFSVIKPLQGSPVGRTTLCFLPAETEIRDERRDFPCTREYRVHVLGLELVVKGLPFQQQDRAVAACATTALWSSLAKARDFEDIATATPAQITMLASRTSLPFGRAMPSEGLSIDQMCQAVQSVGMSPLLRLATEFELTRSLIYSATASGISAVLVLKRRKNGAVERHAVAVAGMRTKTTAPRPSDGIIDESRRLVALYLHDDRHGPYLRADVARQEGMMKLRLKFRRDSAARHEAWQVTHVLVPTHGKIRISLSGLRDIALQFAHEVGAQADSRKLKCTPRVDFWVERAPKYWERVLDDGSAGAMGRARGLATKFLLPRYVGVIRVSSPVLGCVDMLIDTTSTEQTAHPIVVVAQSLVSAQAKRIAEEAAATFRCTLYQ